jgi:transcriptional regulator with XRE-family HTH domain
VRAKALGPLLRSLRATRGLGLRETARLAHLSPTYLSRMEAGHEARPSEDALCRLDQVLDVSPDALLHAAGRAPGDVLAYVLLGGPGLWAHLRALRERDPVACRSRDRPTVSPTP